MSLADTVKDMATILRDWSLAVNVNCLPKALRTSVEAWTYDTIVWTLTGQFLEYGHSIRKFVLVMHRWLSIFEGLDDRVT